MLDIQYINEIISGLAKKHNRLDGDSDTINSCINKYYVFI